MNGPAIERLATKFLKDRGVEARVIWKKWKNSAGGMYGIVWGSPNFRFLRVPVESIPTYDECEYHMSEALQQIRRSDGY